MKRVLFLTTYASPYRVRFFDELARSADVTVLFSERIEDKKHRDASWFVQGEGRAKFIQLRKRIASFRGKELCADVLSWLKKDWDAIVICGYSSPTFVAAMEYLRLRRIPFYMEVDGGLIRQDSRKAFLVKKWLVTRPTWYLSTGKQTSRYLMHYGAKPDAIYEYPFSSLWEADLLSAPASPETKQALRRELGICEKHVILTVGQFIHRKGFDVLLKAASHLMEDTAIYFVGGEPTEEYRRMAEETGTTKIHFVGFRNKQTLAKYYQASDVYVMPTREDIWGLVINEAMAYGLPVVTTDRCVAGMELVENGVNGYVVPVEDADVLADKLNAVLLADLGAMGRDSLRRVQPYTIENMARVHMEIFG